MIRTIAMIVISVLLLVGVVPVEARRSPSLPFRHDVDAALADARASDRPVVVAFVAAWCPVCADMKRGAFRDPQVLELADDFVWVRVDIDRDLTTAREYGVSGVPAIYVLAPDGEVRERTLGFQNAEDLRANLAPFREGSSSDLGPRPEPRSGAMSSLVWKPNGYRGSGVCFSHVGYGPLRLYSQSPFQSLRLGIRPRTPSTIGKGQLEAFGSLSWANVWGLDGNVGDPDNEFFLDFEMLQTTLALSYGITDTIELEGEFQNRNRFGGELDTITQGFHDLFGVDQNGRDEVPKDEFLIDLSPPDGEHTLLEGGDKGSFSRTVQLSFQHNLTCGSSKLPAIAYSVTGRLETLDNDLSGGGDLDVGVSVSASRRFDRVYLYGTFGYTWFGQDRFRGIELDDQQLVTLLAFEWRFYERHSFVGQWMRSDGLIDGFGPFASTSNEVTLGWKWELRQRGILEVGLIENIGEFDNSPDFGVHVGFSQRFGPFERTAN